MPEPASGPERLASATRVGLFGLLGCGNIGNDASMEAVLAYLRADHPDAIVDAMCLGPETVKDRYGIAGIPLRWSLNYQAPVYRMTAVVFKVLGRCIDVFRTANWVRRHDVVIVPGMGVLETSLPTQPWHMPYAMFLLSVSGRIFGTKVALVSVGAGSIKRRLTRRLLDTAADLAFYRSYRDTASREAMRRRGLDVSRDSVYPDLAFSLPVPSYNPGDSRVVCVGVMDYHGGNDDRRRADHIYTSYIGAIKSIVRWLIDDGRRVRLIIGDTNDCDEWALQDILADAQAYRLDLDPDQVVAVPVTSFAEVMHAMAPASIVVATRFHNVVCALRLSKPTIALGYAPKFTALMADMGLSDFCQPAQALDAGQLIEQFTELEKRQLEVRKMLEDRNAAYEQLLSDQFSHLSAILFGARQPTRVGGGDAPVQRSVR
jgi:polysaccharide pyruvyl transferase WcaK-like protein